MPEAPAPLSEPILAAPPPPPPGSGAADGGGLGPDGTPAPPAVQSAAAPEALLPQWWLAAIALYGAVNGVSAVFDVIIFPTKVRSTPGGELIPAPPWRHHPRWIYVVILYKKYTGLVLG